MNLFSETKNNEIITDTSENIQNGNVSTRNTFYSEF